MAKLLVLYPLPLDVTAFEHRYQTEHAPLVGRIPGLTKFTASVVLGTPAGAASFQRVAELQFESLDALKGAMASPAGQAAAAHAVEISTGGLPTVLIVNDDIPD